ncbi:MAG: zinc-dependent alcohol dehydrogenase family protein [Promethearchaeota archaeon]
MIGAKFFGKHDVRVDHYPEPEPGPRDVMVRVRASGVCGTDVHVYEGEVPLAKFPVIPGHEFCGVVERVGATVADVSPGDRVAVEPNLFCGQCHYCRTGRKHFCENWAAVGLTFDGGFAELAVVPRQAVYQMPERLSFEAGAFFEPVACVLHGLERAGVQPGDEVVVLGAGSIGLLFVQLLKRRGAAKVLAADLDDHKLELAEKLGADATTNPSAADLREVVAEFTGGHGADVVVDAAGVPQLTLPLVRPTGRILWFGVPPEGEEISIRPFDVYRREITIVGSFTNPDTNEAALRLLPRLDVEPLVTTPFSDLNQLEGTIRRISAREPGLVKAQWRPA